MPASSISTARLQRITTMLQTYVDDKKLAGMNALISHRGQVVYTTCLGMRDREAAKPVQEDTIFRIASMTIDSASTLSSQTASALDNRLHAWFLAIAVSSQD